MSNQQPISTFLGIAAAVVHKPTVHVLGRPPFAAVIGCLSLFWVTSALGQKQGNGQTVGSGIEPLTTVRVASGLNRPVFATHAPGDFSRLFIVEKRGVIKILDLDSETVLATPFLDIDALVGGGTTTNGERGLLGLAFHPDYETNGFFYVDFTNNSSNTTIRRYTVSADPDVADPASAMILMTIFQPFVNHNGGWLGFGPCDGYLYIASGDGGSGGDPAQDITNQLLGKILRIDVDGDDFPADPNRNYALPVDNPFVGVTGDDEIWAYGLRNPWRPSFDRATGDLYIADVGQAAWEEINFQPAASTGGENYGWRCWEGNHPFNLVNCPAQETMVFPIHEYSHLGGHCSIIGGYVYRGCAIPTLSGTYFFADFCSNQIWSFTYTGGMVTNFTDRTAELAPSGLFIINIASFGEDAAGEIYIVEQSTTGEVFKIVPVTDLDCNTNGVPDACDIANGTSFDVNTNGIPDECECPEDVNGDGTVNVLDLIDLLLCFGLPAVPGCVAEDVNGDGVVNVLDLIDLLLVFGAACP